MFTVVLSALIRRLLHFSNLMHVIMISSILKILLKRNRTIITMEHFPFGFDCFWWIARYLDANARIGGGESLSKRSIQTKHLESLRQVNVVVHVHWQPASARQEHPFASSTFISPLMSFLAIEFISNQARSV